MRLGTTVWIVILVLCIIATIYEMPNVVLNLRGVRNTLIVDPQDAPELSVPDKLVATDPEAGDILRYAMKYSYSQEDPNLQKLKALVARYPQNEYLLSELAENSAWVEGAHAEDILAIVDRLRQIDPNNAHYLYLKGWVLLKTSGGQERTREALKLFDEGHRLPEFHMPYSKYKPRIDRLAERAVLDEFDRPWVEPFYPYLGDHVPRSEHSVAIDKQLLREFISSASRIADRVIENAYDMDSLEAGGEMMQEIEETRLRYLNLSEAEIRQARLRLSRATAIRDLQRRWDDDMWLTETSATNMMPWLILVALPIGLFFRPPERKSPETGAPQRNARAHADSGHGIFMLIATVAFIATHKWFPSGWATLAVSTAWLAIFIFLLSYPRVLAYADASSHRPLWIAYGLLWLNGVLLLLIANTSFLWSRDFAGWSQSLRLLLVWLLFCLLLAFLASHGRPAFGRIPYAKAVAIVLCWAAFLLMLGLSSAKWRYQSRAYAEPFAVYGPLPAVTDETRERVILDAIKDPNTAMQ